MFEMWGILMRPVPTFTTAVVTCLACSTVHSLLINTSAVLSSRQTLNQKICCWLQKITTLTSKLRILVLRNTSRKS